MNSTYTNILESKTLGFLQRAAIAKGLHQKDSITTISKELNFSRQTIHKEIKRGTVIHRSSQLVDSPVYDPHAGQLQYDDALSRRGRLTKVDDDKQLMDFVIEKLQDKYSPEVIAHEINNDDRFKHKVSSRTIYNWVYHNEIGLDVSCLPYAKKKRRKKRKTEKQPIKPNGGESIDLRPNIEDRIEFGHWEIDCVVGKREGKSTSLLTLVERKTRYGIILKIKDKTKKSVIRALKKIKQMFGKYFYDLFLSITADNGSEFKDAIGMSLALKNGKKVKIYYAHAYCSWQRGTNENFNKMIRRWFPKGTDFTTITNAQIQKVNDWINNYPRKQFNYRTSNNLFIEQYNNTCCIVNKTTIQ